MFYDDRHLRCHTNLLQGNEKKTTKEQHEHTKHSNNPPWSKKETDAQGAEHNKMQGLAL